MLSAQGNPKDVSATPPTYSKCVVFDFDVQLWIFEAFFFFLKYSLDSLENKWFIPYYNERGNYI